MKVKGFFTDIGGAGRVTKAREAAINNASAKADPVDPIRALADAAHPGPREYTLIKVYDASPTSKTFRFEPADGHVPVFQAGQYVNMHFKIGESVLTRAYSISSAPVEARPGQHVSFAPDDNGTSDKPYFEITVRGNRPYFVPDYLFKEAAVGQKFICDLPFSDFFYQPLRDSKNLMGLAGGSGITPFASMAKEIAFGKLDCDLTILYGSVKHTDIVCGDQLETARAKAPDKIHIVHIMSDDEAWDGKKGFLTKELIEKYSKNDTTYFFCGPLPMFNMLTGIMKDMGVPEKRFRHEAMQQPTNVKMIPGFPESEIGKSYKMTVVRGINETVVDAKADEPVAVSLERAGIPIDAHCRGGECGFCRAQLLSGDIFVSPLGDGRRREDKEMGWFHSCSAYPTSDIKVKIPII